MNNSIITDEILKEAVSIYAVNWLKNIPEYPQFKTSERFNENMTKILNMKVKKRKITSKKVLIILVAVLVILISSLSVSAVRETIFDFFIKRFETHDAVTINTEKGVEIINDTIVDVYELGVIPNGYELIETMGDNAFVFTLYLNTDKQIVFEQYTEKYYKENINNKNTIITNEIINNKEYYISYIKKSKEYKIVWREYGYVFCLTGGLNKNDMINICENIQKKVN